MLRVSTFALLLMVAGMVAADEPDGNATADAPDSQTLEIGRPAVDFTATGSDGKPVQLSDKLKQDKHIVLIFSRASW